MHLSNRSQQADHGCNGYFLNQPTSCDIGYGYTILPYNIKFRILIILEHFDSFDQLTSHYLLPLGGLVISLFYGWIVGKDKIYKLVKNHAIAFALLWSTRVLAPIAILVMILNSMT